MIIKRPAIFCAFCFIWLSGAATASEWQQVELINALGDAEKMQVRPFTPTADTTQLATAGMDTPVTLVHPRVKDPEEALLGKNYYYGLWLNILHRQTSGGLVLQQTENRFPPIRLAHQIPLLLMRSEQAGPELSVSVNALDVLPDATTWQQTTAHTSPTHSSQWSLSKTPQLMASIAPASVDAEELQQQSQLADELEQRVENTTQLSMLEAFRDQLDMARLAMRVGEHELAQSALEKLKFSLSLETQNSEKSLQELQQQAAELLESIKALDFAQGISIQQIEHLPAYDEWWQLYAAAKAWHQFFEFHLQLENQNLEAGKLQQIQYRAERELALLRYRFEQIESQAPDTLTANRNAAEKEFSWNQLAQLALWDRTENYFRLILAKDQERQTHLQADPELFFWVHLNDQIKYGDFKSKQRAARWQQVRADNLSEPGFVPGNGFRPPEEVRQEEQVNDEPSQLTWLGMIPALAEIEMQRLEHEWLERHYDTASGQWIYRKTFQLEPYLMAAQQQAQSVKATLVKMDDAEEVTQVVEHYLRRALLAQYADRVENQLFAWKHYWKAVLVGRSWLSYHETDLQPVEAQPPVIAEEDTFNFPEGMQPSEPRPPRAIPVNPVRETQRVVPVRRAIPVQSIQQPVYTN